MNVDRWSELAADETRVTRCALCRAALYADELREGMTTCLICRLTKPPVVAGGGGAAPRGGAADGGRGPVETSPRLPVPATTTDNNKGAHP